jgi:hypothetical protein
LNIEYYNLECWWIKHLDFYSFLAAGKKKQLHVDKPDDDLVVNPYDALDDDDFM